MHEDFEPENAKELRERFDSQLAALLYPEDYFCDSFFFDPSDEIDRKSKKKLDNR